MKERLLNEMPEAGKKRKVEDGSILEITRQEGEFDDDDIDIEINKIMQIQLEKEQIRKNIELLEKRQRYIRLMNIWVKILDNYSVHLTKNEVKRITEGLYFLRCEDFTAKQLERLESRAINIIRTKSPVFIPDARKLPESVLKVSLIDRKRWIDPCKVHKNDFYGKIQEEIDDPAKFNYLYNKAKELGNNQTKKLEEK